MTESYGICPACHRTVRVTSKGHVRVHGSATTTCPGSGMRPAVAS